MLLSKIQLFQKPGKPIFQNERELEFEEDDELFEDEEVFEEEELLEVEETSDGESEALTNQLLEEESETETLQFDEEEEISPLGIQDKIINSEVDDAMQDAPFSDYHSITRPGIYTFDDYGCFLLDVCPKIGLDGEKTSLALTKWLSEPSVLTRNMLVQINSNSILDVWKYFEKIEEYNDLALYIWGDQTRRILTQNEL